MGVKKLPIYKDDPSRVVAELTDILRISDRDERMSSLGTLLRNEFDAHGCIIQLLGSNNGRPEEEALFFGRFPYNDHLLVGQERIDFIKRNIDRMKVPLKKSEETMGEKTATSTFKVSDQELIHIIASVISRKDTPFATVLILKNKETYGNNEEVFRNIGPHIVSILAK